MLYPVELRAHLLGKPAQAGKILIALFTVLFGQPCETVQTDETWEKTRLKNLVRHKSGRYYARAFAGGKEVWKSLKTSHFSVAQARLAEFLKEHRQAHQQWQWRGLRQDAVWRGRCDSSPQS
jgi:hypothetical protein